MPDTAEECAQGLHEEISHGLTRPQQVRTCWTMLRPVERPKAGAHKPVQLQSYIPGVLSNFRLPRVASDEPISVLEWIQSNGLGMQLEGSMGNVIPKDEKDGTGNFKEANVSEVLCTNLRSLVLYSIGQQEAMLESTL